MRIKDMKGARKGRKERTVLRCPHCGSDEIVYEAGLITGYKYYCKECMYMGPLIIRDAQDGDSDKRRPGRDASGTKGGGGSGTRPEARGKGKGSDGKG